MLSCASVLSFTYVDPLIIILIRCAWAAWRMRKSRLGTKRNRGWFVIFYCATLDWVEPLWLFRTERTFHPSLSFGWSCCWTRSRDWKPGCLPWSNSNSDRLSRVKRSFWNLTLSWIFRSRKSSPQTVFQSRFRGFHAMFGGLLSSMDVYKNHSTCSSDFCTALFTSPESVTPGKSIWNRWSPVFAFNLGPQSSIN